jgi:hypothetical protein
MTVVFETSRFRVHITDKIAWIENRESAQWVLKAQLALPVSAESLSGNNSMSALQAAVLEFEDSRAGDTGLRAALTGYHPPATVRILPRRDVKSARFETRPALRTRTIWAPQPLRPPLAAKSVRPVAI